MKTKAYTACVRPILEYAVAVWSPWTDADCQILEKVQRRAVRAMCDVRGYTYEEKLRDAGLVLLEERRIRGDLIEVFKVMRGINKVRMEEWFELVDGAQRNTRQNADINEVGEAERRPDTLKSEWARLEVRKNFFTVRVVEPWNSLPANIKNATNVNT